MLEPCEGVIREFAELDDPVFCPEAIGVSVSGRLK